MGLAKLNPYFFFTIFICGATKVFAENRRKVTATLKTRLFCDFGNCHFTVKKQKLLRFLQADFRDVFKRSHPRVLLEKSAEVLSCYTADFCKMGKFNHAHIVIVNKLQSAF